MKKKYFKRKSFLRKRFFIAFISGIIFSLIACKTIDTNAEPELSMHVFKPVAFISVNPPSKLKSVWKEIINSLEKKLKNLPFLGKVVGYNEQEQKFNMNPKLKSKFKTYINTLSLTGISDKEIALKLEKKFGIQYFLFFEVLSYPCTIDCSSNHQWLVRLKLIESRSGDLIFWARKKHEISEGKKNTEYYKNLALKASNEIVNEFARGFIIPWHQWRYNHLTTKSNQIDRGKLGI